MVSVALTNEEIQRCFPVMAELRHNLNKHDFLSLVASMQQEGYQLAYIETDKKIVAVAGFRISTNLFMGKNLYVDDLVVTETSRSKAYGESMISWLREQAVANDCKVLHLDSGTQRHQAHKFYLVQGFKIASYHFSEEL